MTMRKQLFVLALAAMVSVNSTLFAQQPDIPKYGRDIEEHLNKSVYQIDSSANAVVLFDKGVSSIRYDKENGYFYLEITRHKRVKVLTKEGVKWADESIPLYKSGTTKERLSRFQATTYNLENGKVKSEKINLRSVIEEEVSDKLDYAKFTMPQVKEGSVFEFSYTVVSEFTYSLQPWVFQSEIPTLVSFYTVVIPEYYIYNHRLSGYENIKQEKTKSAEIITFSSFQREQKNTGNVSSQNVKYETEWQMYYGYDIPALRYEPFTDNINNYISKVDFELQYTRFPGQIHKSYALDWNTATRTLLEHVNFGRELENTGFLKEEITSLVANKTDNVQKMLEVYSQINKKIKWNNRYSLFADNRIRKAYSEGSGNSAEVNLCLVAALREAGLDAFPIALSTRSNGLVHEWEVSLGKFNHVIAGAYLNGNIVTMDATGNYSVPNILPLECLNGKARIVAPNRSEWIDLDPKAASRSNCMVQVSVDTSLNVSCSVNELDYNYQALNKYNRIFVDNNPETFQKSLSSKHNNGTVENVKTSHTLTPVPQVKVSYNAEMPNGLISRGDMVYITPGAGLLPTENPFVSGTRKLPMNFHYPFIDNYMFVYKLPQGYEIQEVPQNARFSLPDGKANYVKNVLVNGNDVTMNFSISIMQTLFLPEEYAQVKEFFDQLIAANSQMIVLKKSEGK